MDEVAENVAISPSAEAGALAALIGSRICHDLVNPVGAISNGVELLQMTGFEPDAPELALVADSVAHTAARLKFFRVAYGVADESQMMGRSETALILADAYGTTRFSVEWAITSDQPRPLVKIAFLLLQCVESALPRGGEIHVSCAQDRWRIEASGPVVTPETGLWSLLSGGPLPQMLKPGDVHFALAPRAASAVGRQIEVTQPPSGLSLTL